MSRTVKKGGRKSPLKNVYISSIYQNAGKTTVCLGIYKALRERKLKTAFMKPVGQETVNVDDHNIDKDSYLIGEVYKCRKRLKDMSPVTIGPGYTEKYIFHPEGAMLREKIQGAFKKMARGKDVIIIEGTGHSGVGSVIDLSNATVAASLGSKVIIVSEGGIGKSIDEIMLNKALFDMQNVEILGVIVNKVLPEKYERVKKALTQGLRNKGIRLLGVIPLDPLLISPTIGQVMNLLKMELLSGQGSLNRRVKNAIVAAMEPYNMVHHINTSGTLVITSGDRVDNIMAAVTAHLVTQSKSHQISGIILTGGLTPNDKVVDMLKKSKIPVLLSPDDTFTVATKVEHLICKIQKTDKDKILEAYQLVKRYVDIDAILAAA